MQGCDSVASFASGASYPQRHFNIPSDLEVLDFVPIPFWITDFGPENPHAIWANAEGLSCWRKDSLQHFRDIDMSQRSEGIKKFHDELHDSVVVKRQSMGPFRRTMHPNNVARVVDHFVSPLFALCPGEETPRFVILHHCSYVPEEKVDLSVNCSHEMLNRVSTHTLLFIREGGFVQSNPEARRHYRTLCGEAELTLQKLLDCFVWEDEEQIHDTLTKIQDLAIGDGAVVFERAARQAEAQEAKEVWYKMMFIATNDPFSGKPAVLVTGAEITEQRTALADLLRLNHQQEEFFAKMTHELRTPLHCIAGLAEGMLADISRCPSWKRNISLIRAEGMRLAAIVSDIVDAASKKRKTLLIKHEKVSLRRVVERACETMSAVVKKGVKLVNQVPADLPAVEADSQRIIQVLVNLMSNSIRFTSKGFVKVKGRLRDKGRRVELAIQDSGIGIPAEKLPSIFGAFEVVGGDTTRQYGGSGLGLALVKTLVEAHNGTVSVASQHGGSDSGTTFSIVLPVQQPLHRQQCSLTGEALDRAGSGLERCPTVPWERCASMERRGSEEEEEEEEVLSSQFVRFSERFGASQHSGSGWGGSFLSLGTRRGSMLSALGYEIEKERGELQERIRCLEAQVERLQKQAETNAEQHHSLAHPPSLPLPPSDSRPTSHSQASTQAATPPPEASGDQREDTQGQITGSETVSRGVGPDEAAAEAAEGAAGACGLQHRLLLRMVEHEALGREAAEKRERLAVAFRQRSEAQVHLLLHSLVALPRSRSTLSPHLHNPASAELC